MKSDATADTTMRPKNKSYTRFFPGIARILIGLPLLIFGFNAFLNFIPPPPTPLPPAAADFLGALIKSGYMLKLVGITHLLVGAMLVTNRFVPLALILLAPFLVNSVAFHLFLEPSGLIMSGVFLAIELYLAWVYRRAYQSLFQARITLT